MIEDNQKSSQNNEDKPSMLEFKKNQKQFKMGDVRVSYNNNYKIEEYPKETVQKLTVNNYLCTRNQEKLSKITQISFQNKVVTIEDDFELHFPDYYNIEIQIQNNESIGNTNININQSKNKKIQIMKRSPFIQDKDKDQKRDTKNIVKNIMKLFINWLSIKEQIYHQSIVTQVKTLTDQIGFNNRLIQNFAKNQSINEILLEFLENQAEKYIIASKIHDKTSHLEAIKLYKKFFLVKRNQESLDSYRSASQMEEQNEESQNFDKIELFSSKNKKNITNFTNNVYVTRIQTLENINKREKSKSKDKGSNENNTRKSTKSSSNSVKSGNFSAESNKIKVRITKNDKQQDIQENIKYQRNSNKNDS